MKKLLLTAAMVALFGLSSCKKDEGVTPAKKETVKGTETVECRNCGNGSWD